MNTGGNTMTRKKLTAIIGPMFSGKTTELIEIYDSMKGESPAIFKPVVDNRYGVNSIGSHDGVNRPAIVCVDTKDIIKYIENNTITAVLIDEAQFFDAGIVKLVDEIVEQGVPVYFSALNQNYLGRPFNFKGSARHIGELIAASDDIRYKTAICDVCGGKATKTQRLAGLEQEVLVGGSESYSARCAEHHTKKLLL